MKNENQNTTRQPMADDRVLCTGLNADSKKNI